MAIDPISIALEIGGKKKIGISPASLKRHKNLEIARRLDRERYIRDKEKRKTASKLRSQKPEVKIRAKITILKRKFNLSEEQAIEVVRNHKGPCEICGRQGHTKRSLVVDHCHKTGKVRGLICTLCNVILGQSGESPELLRKLADFLERTSYGY